VGQTASPAYVPTSVHLSKMLDLAEEPHVSIGWLMERLGRRSFGLTLFVMAVIAFLPGASSIVGVLIGWPAIQMVLVTTGRYCLASSPVRRSAWRGWHGPLDT
jgi:hypothetical protein